MGSTSAYLIYRKITHSGNSLLKLVDFVGELDLLSQFNPYLQNQLMGDSEYIEFTCFGLEEELTNAGFIKLKNNSNISVPKFHEPLVYDKSPIYWSVLQHNKSKKLIICCGDADQDRPNMILNKL